MRKFSWLFALLLLMLALRDNNFHRVAPKQQSSNSSFHPTVGQQTSRTSAPFHDRRAVASLGAFHEA